jgi:hypothetical protein
MKNSTGIDLANSRLGPAVFEAWLVLDPGRSGLATFASAARASTALAERVNHVDEESKHLEHIPAPTSRQERRDKSDDDERRHNEQHWK